MNLKSTFRDCLLIFVRNSTPRIALVIEIQRNDEVEPCRWKVQCVAGLKNNFVHHSVGEVPCLPLIRIGPIDGRMTSRRMPARMQHHVLALIRMGQDVPLLPFQYEHKVARKVVMRFRDDPLHPESAIDAAFVLRIDHEESWLLRNEHRQLVVHEIALSAIRGIQSEVPVVLVDDRLCVACGWVVIFQLGGLLVPIFEIQFGDVRRCLPTLLDLRSSAQLPVHHVIVFGMLRLVLLVRSKKFEHVLA
mmetsp:Transcript_11984/g.34644  ORF Transcript_11984/g.34644 Transcript_11984/m.34644 type:complete len:247 (+) Transcript_11984:59-799(+)